MPIGRFAFPRPGIFHGPTVCLINRFISKGDRCMKRTLISSASVLTVALAVTLAGFAQSSGVKTDKKISENIANVDPARIQNTDLNLQNFRTRHSCSDEIEPGHGVTAAREFIFNQYSALPGLQVRR